MRELSNVLERAAVVADHGVIQAHDLPSHLRTQPVSSPAVEAQAPVRAAAPSIAPRPAAGPSKPPDASLNLEELERWAIEQALVQAQGNISEVVKKLGMGKTTLYRKLKKYGIR